MNSLGCSYGVSCWWTSAIGVDHGCSVQIEQR